MSGGAKKVATRDAYGETLVELGRLNPDVVVLDADLSKSTKTVKFAGAYPDRFFNMGIAESDMMATAAGLAAAGKIPFASTFAVFAAGRAYDQIRSHAAYPSLGVKIVSSHGGLTVGEDGASHQGLEDLALMRALPNMTVIVPADAVETRGAILAVADLPGPAYVRLGRPAVPVILPDDHRFEVGKAVLLRAGEDAAILACGYEVHLALEAAEMLLKGDGIRCRVLNVSTLKPLDEAAVLAAACETGALVTAEEHSVIGGLGSAVCELLAETAPTPVTRVGVRDRFGESGSPAELVDKYGLSSAAIADAVRGTLARK